jgi:hypothetical protein
MFKNSTQKLLWLWNTVESHLDAANWSSPYCPWTSPSHTASKQLGDTFVHFSGLGSHRPIHFCRAVATSGTHFGKARWLVWTLSPKVFLLVHDPQLLLSCQGRFYQAVSDGWVGASRDLLNLVDIYIYMNVGPVGPGLSRVRFSFFAVPLRCVDRYNGWRLLCTQEQQSIKQTIWRSMELVQRFGPFTADVAPMDYPCGNTRLTIAKENAICSEEECVQRAAAPWRTPQVSYGMVSCVRWIPPAEVYIWPVSCLQIRSSLVSTQHRVASHNSGKNVHAGCGCPSLERSAPWLVNSLSTCPVFPVPFWGHMEAPDEIRFMALSVRLVSLI